MKKTFEFIAVGMKYRNGHNFSISDSGKISLEREPDNKYDKNAIKIMLNSKHIAYVAKDYNIKMNKILNKYSNINVKFIKSYPASACLCIEYKKRIRKSTNLI